MRRRSITIALALAAVLWCATVGIAYQKVRLFETTPGRAADSTGAWPAASRLPRQGGKWTLVMLVHPHCSCSRASVKELEEIVDHAPASLQTFVVFYRPHDAAPGWERTDVVDAASHLHRARIVIDDDGREARVFGGFTSGQTYLYDADGGLRFAGGITSLRGHAGRNSGSVEVINIASTRAGKGTHPVFGCAIIPR